MIQLRLLLLGLLALPACVTRSAEPVRLERTRGDAQLEQVTLEPKGATLHLEARLVARGAFSAARRGVVVTAVGDDGSRREVARARLDVEPARRSPPRHGRTATLSVDLPGDVAFDHLEIGLEPARAIAR